ncbi:hypothetical protein WJR50_18020 [Catalinimonas sp. 4WD22]|uniref:hypothetical protein n=1 Tax=Catalinimonas locisalis TaxID=3133978 RepID=UPI0031013EF8
MKKSPNSDENTKLVMYSEEAYIMHLGKEYEEKILNAQKTMNPVITVKNINGCNSSIPLERALNLLEKYYKLTKQSSGIKDDSTKTNVAPIDKKTKIKDRKVAEKLMLAGTF